MIKREEKLVFLKWEKQANCKLQIVENETRRKYEILTNEMGAGHNY